MNSPAPLFNSAIFNTAAFNFTNYLTKNQADQLYVSLYLMPSSAGTATANKLMITDASNSIQSINQIGFNSMLYNGTIVTATGTELNYLHGVTPGTATASNAIVLDSSRNITNINAITSGTLTTSTSISTPTITCTSSSTAINISGVSGDIVLSGTATSIQCLGAASGIVITGTSSFLTIGASASLILNSVTLTSTGTELNYLHGSTPGTGTASNALVLDASRNITNINSLSTATMSISSSFNITATTDSTSVSTGSFTTLGGIGIAKSLFVGTSISVPNASGGDMITLTSTSTSTRNTIKFITDSQTWECGTRSSTSSNPNTFYLYNSGYRLVMQPDGRTKLFAPLNIDAATSHISLTNGTNSGLIEVPGSPNMMRFVSGYAINVSTNGVRIGSASIAEGRCALDFGQTARDMIISLYNDTSSYYGFGANNSNVEYSAGGGHAWYSSCTNATPINVNTMVLSSTGNLATKLNTIANGGLHAYGFDTSTLNTYGEGVHMHYAGSKGAIFTYNYNAGSYGNLALNNTAIQALSNGYVNINTSSVTQNSPLAVFGSSGFTRSTGFGYLASSGSGTATGFTNRPFSIYSEWGIIVGSGEIDVFSDLRMKKNVLPLNDDLCYQFIHNINPISFKYTHDEDREHYGYSAQQLMSYGYTTLVGTTHADQPLPEEKIPTYIPDTDGELGDMKLSGETIDLPGDVRLCVSMIDMIPILHKCIQKQQERLDDQQNTIDSLQEQINILREKCYLMAANDVHISEPTPTPIEVPKRNRIFIKKRIRL